MIAILHPIVGFVTVVVSAGSILGTLYLSRTRK